jgi:hypothetical protein
VERTGKSGPPLTKAFGVYVTIVLTSAAGIIAGAVYTAWLNGAFRRCPHCRKIGSWRYDSAEPAVVEKDEDGGVVGCSQIRVCRKDLVADVIVLGAHGRRGLTQLLLGSDAESVVRSAPVPVLLVRGRAALASPGRGTGRRRSRPLRVAPPRPAFIA